MLSSFDSIKSLLKLDDVTIDNNTFRLHYKATVIILAAFSLVVTSTQYIGDPMECDIDHEKMNQKLVDTYCWIHSTFLVKSKINASLDDVVAPGIGDYRHEELVYHEYYQWVCFMLFFQAICFYVSRFVWKSWEGGRMKILVLNLDCPIVDEKKKIERKNLLIDYFVSHMHRHNFYALRFLACEVFNFANVVAQIYLTDHFIGGGFKTYGLDVLRYSQPNPLIKDSPFNRLFPKMANCLYRPNGKKDSDLKYNFTCILPVNLVNEKIYLFLWFWFMFLLIQTGLVVILRVVTFCVPTVRLYLLKAQQRLCPRDHIKTIVNSCYFGDWFLLYQLGKNVDSFIFKEFADDLAKRLRNRKPWEVKEV